MNDDLRSTVQAIKASGITTLGSIAKALQRRGIKTPAGATTWHRAQVSRLLDAKESAEPPVDPGTPATVATSATVRPLPAASDSGTASSSPSPDLVHIVITANHVPLPVEDDDTVRPGWQSATRTSHVYVGRRLRVPEDLAELLAFRRQAVALSP